MEWQKSVGLFIFALVAVYTVKWWWWYAFKTILFWAFVIGSVTLFFKYLGVPVETMFTMGGAQQQQQHRAPRNDRDRNHRRAD